jgi:hypothetical protein
VVRALRIEATAFYQEASEIVLRLARWIDSPCARPVASTTARETRSKRRAEEDMREHLGAMSDYAGCTQVKYEYAAGTDASPEELLQLSSHRHAAADELACAHTQ